jgi:2',3'-cyclic-nucleotide 2'-phosphodiesterase (5'-nucleotidase family)
VARVEILHWNDVHARFGALARLSARARQVRDAAPHPVLLLDGGDVEDTSVRLSAMTYGVAGWRLLKAAGVDAAVVGNGGLLRYGPAVLPRYAAALGSPPLVCDVETDDGRVLEGTARGRLLDAGDVRVGVVGVTDYYFQYDTLGLRERGRVTAVREEALRLRAEGADVVVLLSHTGVHADRAISWALRGTIDLIVGGHTHHLLLDGDRDEGVPIAQAGCFGEHLGRVVLEVDRTAERPVQVVDMTVEPVTEDAPADPAVLAETERAEADLEAWLDEPLGHLDEEAPHDGDGRSHAAEVVLTALLDRFPAEVGVLIAAHCTDGLPGGAVRRRDVWATTSSPGNPATGTLTGAELRAMLRRGWSEEYAAHAPRTFRFRPFGRLQTVGVDERDGELLVGGEPLDDDRRYSVTGSDLELAPYGGLVSAHPEDVRYDSSVILPEALEAWFSRASGAGSRAARRPGSPASR